MAKIIESPRADEPDTTKISRLVKATWLTGLLTDDSLRADYLPHMLGCPRLEGLEKLTSHPEWRAG